MVARPPRRCDVAAVGQPRMLVVPESVNPGWSARAADGTALTAVTVNGWQQGWVLPAGTSGAVTLDFPSNTTYRIGLVGGLALLPVLLLLAFLPVRRVREPDDGAAPGAGAGRCGRRGARRRLPRLRRRRRRGPRRRDRAAASAARRDPNCRIG